MTQFPGFTRSPFGTSRVRSPFGTSFGTGITYANVWSLNVGNPTGSKTKWAFYTGAQVNGVAVDSSGNAYAVGKIAEGVNVWKIGPTGNLLASAMAGNGSSMNGATCVCVDSAGNVYVGTQDIGSGAKQMFGFDTDLNPLWAMVPAGWTSPTRMVTDGTSVYVIGGASTSSIACATGAQNWSVVMTVLNSNGYEEVIGVDVSLGLLGVYVSGIQGGANCIVACSTSGAQVTYDAGGNEAGGYPFVEDDEGYVYFDLLNSAIIAQNAALNGGGSIWVSDQDVGIAGIFDVKLGPAGVLYVAQLRGFATLATEWVSDSGNNYAPNPIVWSWACNFIPFGDVDDIDDPTNSFSAVVAGNAAGAAVIGTKIGLTIWEP